MPSGWKKKKKNKKNTAAAGPVVNPNSKNQVLDIENIKEDVPVAADEENEVFKTPRLHLDHEDNKEVNSKDAAGDTTESDVIEKEVILEKTESNVQEHFDVVDNEKPEVLIDEVEASSMDEKVIKSVPWQEEKTNMKKGDANVNSEVSNNKSLDVETMTDDGSKSSSENLAIQNEQIAQVSEVPNVVESSKEIPGQINQNLSLLNEEIDENSDILVAAKEAEKSSSGEYLNTLNVEIHENADTLIAPEEVKTSPSDKGKTKISERTEVAYGPTVAHRATFWNCCGLFDLIAGSDK